MYELFRILFAEQTSADETVVFLVIGAALAFALAFLIYAAVLVVLWRGRMRTTHSLRALLFPSRKRLRRYAAEYTVAATTSLLLSFTVATRHAVVQDVLEQDIGQISREAVASALPFGIPSYEDLMQAGADSTSAAAFSAWMQHKSVEPVGVRADNFIRPLLNAGLVENGSLLSQAAVRSLDIEKAGMTIQRILLAVAILMLIGYAVWFGWRRVRDVQQSGSSDPDYAEIAKRLSVPALCIPLLIVSAAKLDDPDRIARSAAAVASLSASDSEGKWIDSVIVRQATLTRRSSVYQRVLEQDSTATALFARFDERLDAVESAFASLDAVARVLDGLDARIRRDSTESVATHERLDTSVNQLAEQLRELRAGLEDATQRLDAASRDIAAADERLDQLDGRLGALVSELNTVIREARRAVELGETNSERILELERTLARFAAMVQNIAEEGSRPGYLLVVNDPGDPHQVLSPDGRQVAGGEGSAQLHALPAGTYVVTARGFRSNRITLTAGGAATVARTFSVD